MTTNRDDEGNTEMTDQCRRLVAAALSVILVILLSRDAFAVGPYAPSADTYTDRNNADTNNGSDANLLLGATNTQEGGCVETTYLWFKLNIPSTGTTIASASLTLTFLASGSGTTDLELRSSSNTSWSETGITWSNQPGLETGVLGTATGVTLGSTATFSSAALASYLNTRQGQIVSLVVFADCDGSVSTSVALDLRAREHGSGSGASLALAGPTAVTLVSMSAKSQGSLAGPGCAVGVVVALIFLGIGMAVWQHRRMR